MDLKGKKVTVIGLGNSGFNAAMLLKGAGAHVQVTDSSDSPSIRGFSRRLETVGIKFEIGSHSESSIKGSDLAIVSPGIEDTSVMVRWAQELKIPMMGEMELGYRFCQGKIIAVTGTNGKSTVTTLIGKMLKDAGKDAVVCGNIGNSLCGEIGRIREDTLIVLEVSSFQLEKTEKFSPHIALILNITDDHMDRYRKFSDYFDEKLKVFANQRRDDILILNRDAKELEGVDRGAKSKALFYSTRDRRSAAFLESGYIYCTYGAEKIKICSVNDIALNGVHNVENVMASALTACVAGVDAASIRNTIMNFRGLPHRFEAVRTIDGVEYIDDSKSTTVDSTRRALESCNRSVVLIAGGRDKHSDYAAAGKIIRKKVKSLILIGEASAAIKKAIGSVVETHEAKDMFDAVETAGRLAAEGSIVLLSPMCSSFDMFSSYKERGDVFRQAVERLNNLCGKGKL